MTYEIYNYIFIGAAVISVALLVLTVILFFTLKIPQVISDLSGRTERQGVENIRKQNEASGDKSFKSSSVNLKRGKLTDKISKSGRVQQPTSGAFGAGTSTQKIATRSPLPQNSMARQPAPVQAAPAPMQGGNETMVLPNANETMVLPDANETMVLNPEAEATTLLASDQTTVLAQEEGTTLLYNPEPQSAPVVPQNTFEIEIEITYIHTNVVIG